VEIYGRKEKDFTFMATGIEYFYRWGYSIVQRLSRNQDQPPNPQIQRRGGYVIAPAEFRKAERQQASTALWHITGLLANLGQSKSNSSDEHEYSLRFA
jgi:hypothetical protein